MLGCCKINSAGQINFASVCRLEFEAGHHVVGHRHSMMDELVALKADELISHFVNMQVQWTILR